MNLEWTIFGCAMLLALLPVLRRLWAWRIGLWSVALVLGLLTFLLAKWHAHQASQRAASQASLASSIPSTETFSGYISSDKCQACHPQEYASWHRSYHRTMTQIAQPESVLGDFDNTVMEVDGSSVRLERREGEFWADMVDPDWTHDYIRAHRDYAMGKTESAPVPNLNPPRAQKRIGWLTGSHHFQVYWVPSQKYQNVQFAFPFAWLIEDQRWVPRKDVFIRNPHDPSPVQIWNVNCITCHTTAGQPRRDERTGRYSTRVAETGIACESCHGPAEAHVHAYANPARRYFSHTGAPADGTMVNPSKLSAQKSSEICGQCHSVRWNLHRDDWLRQGFQYRPGGDLEAQMPLVRPSKFSTDDPFPDAVKTSEFLDTVFWKDGIVRVTGREYNALVESACAERGALSCLSCHSMHRSDPNDQLAARMDGNEACFQCHDDFRNRLEAHTHHQANSSGSLCYNCHMPHDTYGLLKAVRSHFIHSPDIARSRQAGRLNACNLCHLDQTLEWTVRHLQDWYGQDPVPLSDDEKSVSAALMWLLTGDAAQRALAAWSFGWDAAQAVSGQHWIPPLLAPLLDDPYSAVRYVAGRSLRTLPGFEGLRFDYVGAAPERAAIREQVLQNWEQKRSLLDRRSPAVLLDESGALDKDKLGRLLEQRDDRPVELVE